MEDRSSEKRFIKRASKGNWTKEEVEIPPVIHLCGRLVSLILHLG